MKKQALLNVTALMVAILGTAQSAFAEAGASSSGDAGLVALSAGIAMGLGALGGAMGQGKSVSATLEAVGRNPGAAGNMNTFFFLGLVFIEVAVILSFVIAFSLLGKI